jgi:hypothetical protein
MVRMLAFFLSFLYARWWRWDARRTIEQWAAPRRGRKGYRTIHKDVNALLHPYQAHPLWRTRAEGYYNYLVMLGLHVILGTSVEEFDV